MKNYANNPSIARGKWRQLVRRWDTENYPNILFIRWKPLDRYISSGKREKERERKNEKERDGERERRRRRLRVGREGL